MREQHGQDFVPLHPTLFPPPQWDHLTLPSAVAHRCCSVTKCVQLCNPIDYNMPGSPVLHYLLEFAQIHVH